MSIWDARSNYGKHHLPDEGLPENPAELTAQWLEDALQAKLPDANAMALSTINAAGYPATRVVLLRDQHGHAYHFFTNYNSHKGRELAQNPKASLMFFWQPLERQMRITGTCEKISAADSDAYFASRPRDSQLSAWASTQSEAIQNREYLDEQMKHYAAQFPETVPRPPHWGGYALIAIEYEFWQGQASRLHDRIIYQQSPTDAQRWLTNRLAP